MAAYIGKKLIPHTIIKKNDFEHEMTRLQWDFFFKPGSVKLYMNKQNFSLKVI